MFQFITFIKNAVWGSVVSSPNTEITERQSDFEHTQIFSHIYAATNKTWRSHLYLNRYAESMSGPTIFTSSSNTISNRLSSCETDDKFCRESKDNAFQALEQRYLEQREQRLRDKAIVDQVHEEFLSLQTYCEETENARRMCEETLQMKVEHHQREIEDKEEELVKLIDHYHSTLEAARDAHAAELQSTIQKAEEERHEMEASHLQAMRAVTKASNKNRCTWERAEQSLQADMERMDKDFRDTLRANEDEITRLKKSLYRLEAENRLLTDTVNKASGDKIYRYAQDVLEESQRTKMELEDACTKLKISNEKVENVLEAMQKERDHWKVYGDKEQEAQAQVYDLQKQIGELQEKIKIRDDLLRAADRLDNDSAVMPTDTISIIAFRNEELQEELRNIKEENTKLRAQVNKVDDENLQLCMKLDTMEEELHDANNELRRLHERHSLLQRQNELITNVCRDHRGLTPEHKELLQKHLHEITESNEYLRARNGRLSKKVAEFDRYSKVIEDKCEDAIRKIEKDAKYWKAMYWDEAVPKVETLLQEIHDLNKELGREDIHFQEHLEGNVVVADKNVLRHACDMTLRGVASELNPPEVYEPGSEPGWIPATHDALRLLRPLGWAPVAELEKVWLTPMYKPFTEDDAAYRLEAQEQTARKKHRARMGASPPPEAHLEMPFDNTNSRARSPNHTREGAYDERRAPPYQSAWLRKHPDLTEEVYNDMDEELKLDVLKMVGADMD